MARIKLRHLSEVAQKQVKKLTLPNKPEKKKPKKANSNEMLMLTFEADLAKYFGEFQKEFRFDAKRKFRFDYYLPDLRVGFEINGGEWLGGRHTKGKGYQTDLDKINLAQINGFRVFQFTYTHLKELRHIPIFEQLKFEIPIKFSPKIEPTDKFTAKIKSISKGELKIYPEIDNEIL
jgi:hypothetical protein